MARNTPSLFCSQALIAIAHPDDQETLSRIWYENHKTQKYGIYIAASVASHLLRLCEKEVSLNDHDKESIP